MSVTISWAEYQARRYELVPETYFLTGAPAGEPNVIVLGLNGQIASVSSTTTTAWSLGKTKTVHVGATDYAVTSTGGDEGAVIHLESTGTVTIDAAAITDDSMLFYVTNTDAGAARTITPVSFDGVFDRNAPADTNPVTSSFTINPNEMWIFEVTKNGAFKYLNGTLLGPDGAGATSITDNSLPLTKLAQQGANTLLGNITGATANVTATALTANKFLARSSSGNIAAKDITDAALTVLDDASVSAMRDTLAGTGTLARLTDATGTKAATLNNSNLTATRDLVIPDRAGMFPLLSDANTSTKDVVLNNSALTANRTINLPNLGGYAYILEALPTGIQTASFTAAWGQDYVVSAASGDITVTLPAAATANTNVPIRISREDDTNNVVTVRTATGQVFAFLTTEGTAVQVTLFGGRTLEVISTGTAPYIRDRTAVDLVSRLWLPTDAGTQPWVWYSFRDAATITLAGTSVTAITNKGSGGTTYNLSQGTGSARPTINSSTSPQYATFDGGDSLITAAAVDSMQNGSVGTVAATYQQPIANQASSVFGQSPATGGQLNYHPQWSDGSTYLDMPIISARISGALGTVAAGTTAVHNFLGIRNNANENLYMDGNTAASLTGGAASGSSTGTATLYLGANASGVNNLSGRIYEFLYFRAH